MRGGLNVNMYDMIDVKYDAIDVMYDAIDVMNERHLVTLLSETKRKR